MGERMKTVKFAEDFPKLQKDYFSTIRTPPKDLRSGEIVLIKTPTTEFKGIIIRRWTAPLNDLSSVLLMDDTSMKSREDAINLLKEFYPNLKEDREVQVIWLMHDRRGD